VWEGWAPRNASTYTEQHKQRQNSRVTSMYRVGLEPTIPVLQRQETCRPKRRKCVHTTHKVTNRPPTIYSQMYSNDTFASYVADKAATDRQRPANFPGMSRKCRCLSLQDSENKLPSPSNPSIWRSDKMDETKQVFLVTTYYTDHGRRWDELGICPHP
jgi:hypothetical protein